VVTVQARVIDATHLELAEPIQAAQGARVTVSVSEAGDEAIERKAWLLLSAEALGRAYTDTEPDYPPDLVREQNPEYNG